MTRILLSAFLVAFGLSGHVAARCSDAKVGDQFVWARYNDTFIYPLEDPLFNAITPHFSVFESLGVIVNRVTVTNVTLDYMYRDEKFETKGNALNISDVYGNQADEFKGLCEELWACSQFYTQYQAKLADDDYDTRALCFDKLYYIINLDRDEQEFRIRENFVVDSCWGGRRSSDFNNITELKDLRDAICNDAEGLVDRLLFNVNDTADPGACRAAVNCIKEGQENVMNQLIEDGLINEEKLGSALEGESMDGIYSDTGSVAFEVCFEKNASQIQETRDECLSRSTATSQCPIPTYTNRTEAPGCGYTPAQGALPVCPALYAKMFDDFGPGYPTDEAGYVVATASIKSLFIPCPLDRTSADAVGFILFLRSIFQYVVIATGQLKDALPNDFPYIPFVLLNFIPKIIVQSFDIVLKQASYHDGLIQAAEIEALYENNKQLLRASAAIYDEVVCRCVDDFSRPRKGYGCDSIDNNCDDVVDDCTEDNWPPEIFVSAAIAQCSNTWFGNESDARKCVTDLVSALDDCDESLSLDADDDFALNGTCFDSQFTVIKTDTCGNLAEPQVVPVFIDDGAPPNVTCGFELIDRKQLLLLDTGASVLENVGLVYSAQDGCGGDLEVLVEVYSNEIEDFQSQELALLFEDGKENDAAGLYIAKGICSTSSNGQCIKDPKFPSVRIYRVVVSTEDLAGKPASTECSIVILPQNIFNKVDEFDVDASTQRFFLTSYSSTFAGPNQP
jgi:hypothetical protein